MKGTLKIPSSFFRSVRGGVEATITTQGQNSLVAVMVGLVRTVDGEVQVLGLNVRERSKFDIESLEVSTSDLLIELFREHVYTEREFLRSCPESNLRKDLVRERARHDERRVTSSTAINVTSTTQEDAFYQVGLHTQGSLGDPRREE